MMRVKAGAVCLAVVALCFAYHYTRRLLPDWWRENGGGIPYVVFWITFLFFLLPRRRYILPISVFATTMTCGLEFLQLWKPPWLTEIRSTMFGAALLGSGFVWNDIPPYLMGGVLGYGLLRLLSRGGPPTGSPRGS